jgi:hypothetical protein
MGKQMYMMMSEVVNQPSVVNDDLAQSADQKICERQHITISELSVNFHKFHTLSLQDYHS